MTTQPALIPQHPLRAWRLTQTCEHPRTGRTMTLTVREAARRRGVSHVTWSGWETWPGQPGHRMPRHDEMVELCAMTGLQPGDFYLIAESGDEADAQEAA